ncbi:VOC family protein [Streptomyces sp. NPDC088748]|uniref:VOC family protein n=1 Tax=Streptomyces sp. NPDC088748 TaxID=3365887 RepID=UPI003802A0F4
MAEFSDLMQFCQVAMSVTDMRRTHRWYQSTFGYLPAGGTVFTGDDVSRVQDLPDVNTTAWWMVDQQEFFQLEMFQYSHPSPRVSAGRGPQDIGYAMIGVHVTDFDATLRRLRITGGRPLTLPIGRPGARRLCLRDPEGVLIEIMEDNAPTTTITRPGVPVATRFVTLSVFDLEEARQQWLDAFDLEEDDAGALHDAEHETLWGLSGARRRTSVLRAGDRMIELVQYLDPPPNPRPAGYRISDQGLLNIAMGSRSQSTTERAWERLGRYCGEGNFLDLGGAGAVGYTTDQQGFSIELLAANPAWDDVKGFQPQPSNTAPGP